MIEEFIVGNWYMYTGKKRKSIWNSEGLMDYVLDNKPHKCIYGSKDKAVFKGDPRGTQCPWYWSDLSLWEEVGCWNCANGSPCTASSVCSLVYNNFAPLSSRNEVSPKVNLCNGCKDAICRTGSKHEKGTVKKKKPFFGLFQKDDFRVDKKILSRIKEHKPLVLDM